MKINKRSVAKLILVVILLSVLTLLTGCSSNPGLFAALYQIVGGIFIAIIGILGSIVTAIISVILGIFAFIGGILNLIGGLF